MCGKKIIHLKYALQRENLKSYFMVVEGFGYPSLQCLVLVSDAKDQSCYPNYTCLSDVLV